MKIDSLVISRNPTWFDVQGGRLESFGIAASTRFWPAGARGAGLFVLDFDGDVDDELLLEHKIGKTHFGYFIYLSMDGASGSLRQTVTVPCGTLKRIGIQLWNCAAPILLEDISLASKGAELRSLYAVDTKVITPEELESQYAAAPGSKVIALNLFWDRHECTAKCFGIGKHWFVTMDEVQRRHPNKHFGRTNCSLALPDGARPRITVQHAQPAILQVPKTAAEYFDRIGVKSRNMVRKAQKLGYVYRRANPEEWLDDVLAIRTSDPLRQGKPIPEYFKQRPKRLMLDAFEGGCQYHGEEFYGIFKDERLVAYATVFFYGELGQVNHILGHKEHLGEGVMNLLVWEAVNDIIERRPWVRAINYLYPDKPDSGIGVFKRSIGFEPACVVVTRSGADLSGVFPTKRDGPAPAEVEPARKQPAKPAIGKALRESANSITITAAEALPDRQSAFDLVIDRLQELHPQLRKVSYRSGKQEVRAQDFDPAGEHVVVFEKMHFAFYQEFLSAQLKSLGKVVPKNSFLVFDFKRAPDPLHVPGSGDAMRKLASLLRTSRKTNEDLIAYLSKRFKSISLSVEDVKSGFKGSDYVVAGLIDHLEAQSHRSFDSLLVLKKIR